MDMPKKVCDGQWCLLVNYWSSMPPSEGQLSNRFRLTSERTTFTKYLRLTREIQKNAPNAKRNRLND